MQFGLTIYEKRPEPLHYGVLKKSESAYATPILNYCKQGCRLPEWPTFKTQAIFMKPTFLEVIGTDNRKYHVNVNHVLYFYTFEKKSNMLTEIVFNNKEAIESEETPSELEARINKLFEGQS